MRQMMDKILRWYGTEITLVCGSEMHTVTGFFQPSTAKSWQNMDKTVSPLGQTPRGQYTYIGPAVPEPREGDTLRAGGREYILRRLERVLDQNGPVYCWGLCVPKGEEDTWGSQS